MLTILSIFFLVFLWGGVHDEAGVLGGLALVLYV